MNLIFHIEKCLIPRLAKDFDECEIHEEYDARNIELKKHFDTVLNGLKCANLKENLENRHKILAAVLILYKELLSRGPWHSDMMVQCANKLNTQCKHLFGIEPEDFLKTDQVFGNVGAQMIFNECMVDLHAKLTANEFKKHPSVIEVYCSLIENIHDYHKIQVNVKTMPTFLHLIDDYNFNNKKKGLKCCAAILKHLKSEAFDDGNYYEVIYASLKKAFMVRDIEITRLVIECLQELLKIVPPNGDFKIYSSMELFDNTLDHIQSESSLYRKAALFSFLKFLIQINGVNCVSRKTFQSVVCYNLDVCCNKGVDDIMLLPIILCLEEWLKNCWCIWKFYSGHWVLSTLFKLLYICEEDMVKIIVKVTATLVTLCTKEERLKLLTSLDTTENINDQFKNRINLINKYIDVN